MIDNKLVKALLEICNIISGLPEDDDDGVTFGTALDECYVIANQAVINYMTIHNRREENAE